MCTIAQYYHLSTILKAVDYFLNMDSKKRSQILGKAQDFDSGICPTSSVSKRVNLNSPTPPGHPEKDYVSLLLDVSILCL